MTSPLTVGRAFARPTRSAGGRPGQRRQTLVAYGFALPFLAVFTIFMLFPLAASLGMSFTDFSASDITTPLQVRFVGFDQFHDLFANGQFRRAMLNTVYFVGAGIPLTMITGLALAVALNNGITRLRVLFRVGFYAPVVASIVAIAVVWKTILQPEGLLNSMLGWVGISGPDWLNSTTWAMPAMIVMAVWRNTGTLMVIFLAGLQNIPPDVLEAAEVDGAGAWQRFRRVTFPLLRPTLLLGAVLLSVGYLQFFEEPFVMTKGGPLDSTLSVSFFAYDEFGFGNYGTAAAASYVLFLTIAALSVLQFRIFRAQEGQ